MLAGLSPGVALEERTLKSKLAHMTYEGDGQHAVGGQSLLRVLDGATGEQRIVVPAETRTSHPLNQDSTPEWHGSYRLVSGIMAAG